MARTIKDTAPKVVEEVKTTGEEGLAPLAPLSAETGEETTADEATVETTTDEPVAAKAPELMVERTAETVLVANQHTGGITFPRTDANGLFLPPLRLAPGLVTRIPYEEWQTRKKMKVVQHYLDRGILAEVNKTGPVPVQDQTTSELPIPEHLQGAEKAGQYGVAGLRKGETGEVNV